MASYSSSIAIKETHRYGFSTAAMLLFDISQKKVPQQKLCTVFKNLF
jgi:hypothetical protein